MSRAARERWRGEFPESRPCLAPRLDLLELHALLADGEIALHNRLRNRVETVGKVIVDERTLTVLQLIECGRFLKLPTQVGELVVAPNLLNTKRRALFLIPGVIEAQRAGIARLECLGGGGDRLMVCLRRLLRVV